MFNVINSSFCRLMSNLECDNICIEFKNSELANEVKQLAQSIKEKLEQFIVWHDNGRGWTPSKPMTYSGAMDYAEDLQSRGMATRIHPQLVTTLDDLVNG